MTNVTNVINRDLIDSYIHILIFQTSYKMDADTPLAYCIIFWYIWYIFALL